jgi:transcription initiation factor TFIIB
VSLAAASLYLATIETSEYTTQLRIAIAADVSTVTVRKRCLEIIQLVKEGNSQLLAKSIEKTQEMLSDQQVPQHSSEAAAASEIKNVKGLFIASRQMAIT